MPTPDSIEGPTGPTSRSRGDRYGRYVAAWAFGAVPVLVVITLLWKFPDEFHGVGEISLGTFALMFPVAVGVLKVPRERSFILFLAAVGIAFGILSILTGVANGLTDEPFTTPRYVSVLLAGHDPYTVPLVFSYQQYGQTIPSRSLYLYLPLLMFLQVPGLDYKWFTLAVWAGLVILVRKDFDLGIWLAQPYVALVAFNGYNDLPVLFLLTLGFVGWAGRRQRWAEYLSLGAKQFANVIVLVYYLVRRDWRNTFLTGLASAAFLVPFVLWSGPGILCPAVLADRFPGCTAGAGSGTIYLINYSIWIVWTVAVFAPAVRGAVMNASPTSWTDRLRRWADLGMEELLRLPRYAVLLAAGVALDLLLFDAVMVFGGVSTPVVLFAAALGFASLVLWELFWNRAWVRSDSTGPLPWRPFALLRFGALGVDLLVVLGAVVGPLSLVTASTAGALLATLLLAIGYARSGLRGTVEVPRWNAL